jgi:hypothetical protein
MQRHIQELPVDVCQSFRVRLRIPVDVRAADCTRNSRAFGSNRCNRARHAIHFCSIAVHTGKKKKKKKKHRKVGKETVT